MEGLSYDLLTQHEIKHFFIAKPTLKKYTKVDEAYIKFVNFSIIDEEIWDKFCELIE